MARQPLEGDPRSDKSLLASSSSDPDAFGIFFQRHFRAVVAFLYRRTADPELAADLAAETFAAAFLARRRYRDTGAPALAWLLGIARNKLNQTLRRGRVADRACQKLGIERVVVDEISYERVEELADMAPFRQDLRKALATLAPPIAQAVQLRVADQLSYSEVARRLGCSEGAARVRVTRGLGKLAKRLEAS